MKIFIKKALVFIFITNILFNVFAEEIVCKTKNGTLSIEYSSKAFQGDIVYIKLFARKNANTANNSCKISNTNISIIRVNNTKSIINSSFYALKNKPDTYLCLLPVDSMLKAGEFNLKINGTFDNVSFSNEYPLTILHKDFLSETLELNESNTAIKTDSSDKRKNQIAKLNNILFTVNTDAQYMNRTFSFPVTSKRRTAFYGDRRVYAYSNGNSSTSVHFGHDYGVPTGTVVSACANGKVVMAEDRITTGWSVVIEHMPGLYSLYYHMSKLDVEVNQIVKQGEHLGLSGATGLATGPHLHWEVRLLGTAVDPDYFVLNSIY
ncbi:MAG: M23 family metallopeptidase [Treponema sp.]|nr:M23 family metallopeptidase [Treponema sp.]